MTPEEDGIASDFHRELVDAVLGQGDTRGLLKANRIDVVCHNALGESWVLTFCTKAQLREIADLMDHQPTMTNKERSDRAKEYAARARAVGG